MLDPLTAPEPYQETGPGACLVRQYPKVQLPMRALASIESHIDIYLDT